MLSGQVGVTSALLTFDVTTTHQVEPPKLAGVATSSNGVDWTRVPSASSATPSATAEEDQKKSNNQEKPQGLGCVMQPGSEWWTFDTSHMAVADVQV